MPVTRLKEITGRRLRLAPIEKAGFRTVGDVLNAPPDSLGEAPGVGPQTAAQAAAAARQMRLALEEKTRVRIDAEDRTARQTELVTALRGYEVATSVLPPRVPDLAPLAARLAGGLGPAERATSRLRLFFTWPARRKRESLDALAELAALLRDREVVRARKRLATAAKKRQPKPWWVWKDYLARPVDYNGLLIEVAELAPDEESSQGFLPADIAERVRRFRLDQSLLNVSLRAYQSFGAKFALVQGRVIIGDEMGLGKTVEALAVLCHLAAGRETHFLVVCPASVVINWTREVRQHTKLEVHRLHGVEREESYKAWAAKGGVAVTTFEALRTMTPVPGVRLGALVVDEAHYAKNPGAQRTKAVSGWARRSRRVLFLTGTPMENRVEEFRALVGHLRPQLAEDIRLQDGALGSASFRKTVAPVYLRRNQDDVLSELPPRLETDEWVELEGPALAAYRTAVDKGNFMAMRRAAFDPGTIEGSAKLRRLAEVAGEAADGGRKVVVFSYFRDVLDSVTRVLGEEVPDARVIGPLTGDVRPPERQAMVDEFTAVKGPAMLVAQIKAGGVGLNVQAASVVILAEPQLTPAIEEQAIARAHRMGQVRRVDVHRLLCADSVDQRILELLHGKRLAFDEYARRSDMARATPDAVDVSDLAAAAKAATPAELQRQIVDDERRRLSAA
jgi:SNF2 family DNA or RNA helicase